MTTHLRKRWTMALLATAVPVLLAAGLAGASVVARGAGGDDAAVTVADGQGNSVRPAAEDSALLRAAAPSAPETTPEAVPVPVPTTAPPAPPVTEPPVPVTAPVRAPAAGPTMTLVSQYPAPVTITLNGVTYHLAPGQELAGLTVGPQTDGNDILFLVRDDLPSCGEGDADHYFRAGTGHYLAAVVVSRGTCDGGVPGPDFVVTPG